MFHPTKTRWWFQICFIFTPIWGRFPFWQIFFKWVETTNQKTYKLECSSQDSSDKWIQMEVQRDRLPSWWPLLLVWEASQLISNAESNPTNWLYQTRWNRWGFFFHPRILHIWIVSYVWHILKEAMSCHRCDRSSNSKGWRMAQNDWLPTNWCVGNLHHDQFLWFRKFWIIALQFWPWKIWCLTPPDLQKMTLFHHCRILIYETYHYFLPFKLNLLHPLPKTSTSTFPQLELPI